MLRFVLVCTGGAIGSGARYLTGLWAVATFGTAFPLATLIVNVIGSFLMTLVIEMASTTSFISPDVRLFLTTGVLGGFTTYSAFNQETTAMLRDGAWRLGVANVCVTVFGCLLAGFAGIALAKLLFAR
jgi:CrcB protein